jgi:hypothetical protein
MPREKTKEEVKQEFLKNIHSLVDYWNEVDEKDNKERLEGLAFSILVLLDGDNAGSPGFIVAPLPHKDDKQYDIDNGNDYYPNNDKAKVKCDIAGSLHDNF